jgi:hypothetical protein
MFVMHARLLVPGKTPLLMMRRLRNKLPRSLWHLRTRLPHHLPRSLPHHLPRSLRHLPRRSGAQPTRRLPHRRKGKMRLPLPMSLQKDVVPEIGILRRLTVCSRSFEKCFLAMTKNGARSMSAF